MRLFKRVTFGFPGLPEPIAKRPAYCSSSPKRTPRSPGSKGRPSVVARSYSCSSAMHAAAARQQYNATRKEAIPKKASVFAQRLVSRIPTISHAVPFFPGSGVSLSLIAILFMNDCNVIHNETVDCLNVVHLLRKLDLNLIDHRPTKFFCTTCASFFIFNISLLRTLQIQDPSQLDTKFFAPTPHTT